MQAVLTKVGLETTFGNREGLETELGERGVFISGGEAQRLVLARALLADFCVLILDEPTANVDAMSAEQLVRDLLGAAKSDGQRTVILITHDSTLGALADRVVKL
jgi:ATP-binding cassette subfamily C protein CydC